MAKKRSVAGMVVCSLEELPATLDVMLVEYSEKVVQFSREAVQETTKEAAKVVKEAGTYNNRRPKYRMSIKSKVRSSFLGAEGVVYASGHEYSLTHLLENGHKLWQAPLRRTRAFKHWKNGEDYAKEALPKKIIERIGN